MNLTERVLNTIQTRKDNLVKGNINSIPSPFTRFSDDFIGIEQAKMYLVSAATKVGKTQIASYMFLYNALLYAYHHPEKLTVKIFYYALEETPEDVLLRFMSYILYTYSNGRYVIPTNDLLSTKNKKPLSQEVIDILKTEPYKSLVDFFEENVIFQTATNATGVWLDSVKYAEEHGTVHFNEKTIINKMGQEEVIKTFDYYEMDKENEYRIIFYDHVSLISEERGFTLKQSIDKLSDFCVALRNKYKYTPVLVQQQAAVGEGLDHFKEGKFLPSIANLSDSKYIVRNCDVALGLFSPFRQELRDYQGLDNKIF